VALTARPCHPGLGAAGRWPPGRRAQGAGRQGAGRRAQGWLVAGRRVAGRAAPGLAGRVSCVSAHGQPASQHQGWLAAQHQGWLAVCRVCHLLAWHTRHTLRPCVSCGHVCHHFQIEVARQTWKSYTIHTVIIYSIYIPIKSSKCMTHMVHNGGF
jgi:hypothetical protein